MSRTTDLLPGEQVVLSDHPHWWYFWKHVAGGLAMLILFTLSVRWDGAVGTLFGWLAGLAFVVWLATTAYALLNWRTTSFMVTDRRVAYQSGMFRRRGVSIPLNRVNNVNFEQSFIARMLGNGVVTIESAGETGDSVFENIPDPHDVRRTIFEQMQAAELADSTRSAQAVADAMGRGDPGPARGDVEERLRELDRLRDEGLLSEQEYAERRRRVLDDL